MLILGADYGTKGAFAIIDTEREQQWVLDMPMSGGQVDVTAIQKWLETVAAGKSGEHKLGHRLDHIYIEDVNSAGPGAGKTGLLKQGKNIGRAEAVLILFANKWGIPFHPISPQRWKRHQGLWGKDKSGSVDKAIQRFPDCAGLVRVPWGKKFVDKDGRAEALLIADYGHMELKKEAIKNG